MMTLDQHPWMSLDLLKNGKSNRAHIPTRSVQGHFDGNICCSTWFFTLLSGPIWIEVNTTLESIPLSSLNMIWHDTRKTSVKKTWILLCSAARRNQTSEWRTRLDRRLFIWALLMGCWRKNIYDWRDFLPHNTLLH